MKQNNFVAKYNLDWDDFETYCNELTDYINCLTSLDDFSEVSTETMGLDDFALARQTRTTKKGKVISYNSTDYDAFNELRNILEEIGAITVERWIAHGYDCIAISAKSTTYDNIYNALVNVA